MNRSIIHPAHSTVTNLAYRLGFWSAIFVTAGGLIYACVILAAILTGNFANSLSSFQQVFGGIASLVVCPLMLILMASLHSVTPPEKRVFSLICLGFTLLFVIAVSINRFSQLGVVQQSIAAGQTVGIEWFLPYGEHSILFGLEILGWGWFLGFAMLFAAPLFSSGRLQQWIRWLMVLYAALALICALAFLLASPFSVIGFAAWGFVLYIITALMAVNFRQAENQAG